MRTGENKLHTACFESDRLNPQRCCTPTSPIAKYYPTKCLASFSFQDLDFSFYIRKICVAHASLNSTERKEGTV